MKVNLAFLTATTQRKLSSRVEMGILTFSIAKRNLHIETWKLKQSWIMLRCSELRASLRTTNNGAHVKVALSSATLCKISWVSSYNYLCFFLLIMSPREYQHHWVKTDCLSNTSRLHQAKQCQRVVVNLVTSCYRATSLLKVLGAGC